MYDYQNKSKNINQLNQYMLAKTLSMFEYQDLPETIPARELERLLQKNGYAFITEHEGELYALSGSLGGELDAYGNPTTITVANTYLKLSKTFNLKDDGVLISNDDMRMGLLPYIDKQNTLIAENDINMVMWGFNSRANRQISAQDDRTLQSANKYLRDIEAGKWSAIAESQFFDGIKVQGASDSSTSIQPFVEYHQYLIGKMYNEVGLSAAFNMKRERLISSEVDQSEDSLFPLVYNMMANRISAIAAINERYETNIDVDFGSVWALKNKKLVDGITNDNHDEYANSSQPDNQSEDSSESGGFTPSEETKDEEREEAPLTLSQDERSEDEEQPQAAEDATAIESEELQSEEEEDEIK